MSTLITIVEYSIVEKRREEKRREEKRREENIDIINYILSATAIFACEISQSVHTERTTDTETGKKTGRKPLRGDKTQHKTGKEL